MDKRIQKTWQHADFRFGLVGIIVGEICGNLGFFIIQNVPNSAGNLFVVDMGGALLVIGGLYIGIGIVYWGRVITEVWQKTPYKKATFPS